MDIDDEPCYYGCVANIIIDYDYRKASEVALEVLDELNRRFMEIHSEGNCGVIRAISEAYVELKNKYTEEGK